MYSINEEIISFIKESRTRNTIGQNMLHFGNQFISKDKIQSIAYLELEESWMYIKNIVPYLYMVTGLEITNMHIMELYSSKYKLFIQTNQYMIHT